MTDLPNILVIDDDALIGQFLSRVSVGLGMHCVYAASAARFLELLTPSISLILLDLRMPGMDGVELLRILSERKCKTPIILMSGIDRRTLETAERLADELGLEVVGKLRKPFGLAQVESVLQEFRRPGIPPNCVQAASNVIEDEELKRAIVEDEFVLHYQPQIELCSNEVVGFEALVRWQRTPEALLSPDCFIPRIETLGLIDRLGWLVQRRGIAELGPLAQGCKGSPTLSVNVSAMSLMDLELPDKLELLAGERGIEPERIIVEVTEGGFFEDLSKILDVLARLRMKRFQISIDDFGTGYAMMQQLRHIPATEIKIDQSFVRNMQVSNSDRIVVEKTVEIGHELGMKVVAEGVETMEQLNFLRKLRCDVVQGYYFSKPLAPWAMRNWLAAYECRPDDGMEPGLRSG